MGRLYQVSKLDSYKPPSLPEGYDWPSLLAREGVDLEQHYRATLERLSQQPGTLGVIFRKAQNKIQEPAMLTRLIKELIDVESWLSMSADVKGDAYESLLERNAQDVKTGAGQYFTPRPLIQAIVDVMQPVPAATICDPTCGTPTPAYCSKKVCTSRSCRNGRVMLALRSRCTCTPACCRRCGVFGEARRGGFSSESGG